MAGAPGGGEMAVYDANGDGLNDVVTTLEAHGFGLDRYIDQQTSNWIQLLFATPVVLWAGWPFFQRGWQSLVTRNLNMFTLIAMGTGAAWIYSVVATLAPDIFPDAFRQHDGSVAVYFEAAAVITVLVLLGQVLELRARESTSGAIRALLDLAADGREGRDDLLARVVEPDVAARQGRVDGDGVRRRRAAHVGDRRVGRAAAVLDEEVDRLLAHGAMLHADLRGKYGPGTGWVTLADPEGNLFCVLRSDGEIADLTASG